MAMTPAVQALRYITVATASGNKTFAQQLEDIETAYSGLSYDEKLNSIIEENNRIYYFSHTNGSYFRATANTTNVYVNVMDLQSHIFVSVDTHNGGNTINNNSSTSNSNPMYLKVLR